MARPTLIYTEAIPKRISDMSYELEGTIKAIFDTQTFGKGFTKREAVVTTASDRFPQDIKVEFVKDKVGLLDRFQVGQKVKVTFDLRGGEYNGRYYVSLSAWRIQGADEAADAGAGQNQAPRSSQPRPSGSQGGGGGNRGNFQGQQPRRNPSQGSGGGGYQRSNQPEQRQQPQPPAQNQDLTDDDYIEDAPPGYPF